jgi:uncharacterized Zn finger protein
MSETRTVMQTIQIDYTCDDCGQGQMRSDGMTLTSFPPQYPHECNKCGAVKTFTSTRYPNIVFEPAP